MALQFSRGRVVTLVIVDDDGEIRGATTPFEVAQPWWQEIKPIADVVDGVTVLRLLEATPDPGQEMGGEVTYLAQCDGPLPRSLTLRPWSGALAPDPHRAPWAEPGVAAEDLAWVASVVEVTGPPLQHRAWNLSAIWEIPTSGGSVWLKCVPSFFSHEATVLQELAGPTVPRLVTADRHRILLEAMPGEDGYHADADEQIEMVETLVDLQAGSAVRAEAMVAAGIPDLRAEPLIAELTTLVGRVAPNSEPLNRLVDQLEERFAIVDACGLPDTVVHGDPHPGNCRRAVSPPVWFDWGDAFIGNPLLDLATTHRMGPPAVARWIERWTEQVPGADIERARQTLAPIAALRMAWVYQGFLDNIEQSEHIFHRDDVPQVLAQVEQMMLGR